MRMDERKGSYCEDCKRYSRDVNNIYESLKELAKTYRTAYESEKEFCMRVIEERDRLRKENEELSKRAFEYKTDTERMKRRAKGRERLKQAEDRRRVRAQRKGAVEISRPSIGIVMDEDFGPRALQRSLRDAFK